MNFKRSKITTERTLYDRPMVVSNKIHRYLINTEGNLKQLNTNHNSFQLFLLLVICLTKLSVDFDNENDI